MSWLFRKRIKIAPGISINLSKSGISTTMGPKGVKVNMGEKGVYLTTSVPGTGIFKRETIVSASQLKESSAREASFISVSRNQQAKRTGRNSTVAKVVSAVSSQKTKH